MPARYNIAWSVSKKEDLARSYRLRDKAKVPVDLTGAAIVYKAKSGNTVIEATIGNGRITIDDAADGVWSILVPKAELADAPTGSYVHDLLITIDGVTTELFVGSLELRPGV